MLCETICRLSGLQGNGLVERHITAYSGVIAKRRHCISHAHLITVTDLNRRIGFLNMPQQHLRVHQLCGLTLLGLLRGKLHLSKIMIRKFYFC